MFYEFKYTQPDEKKTHNRLKSDENIIHTNFVSQNTGQRSPERALQTQESLTLVFDMAQVSFSSTK